MSQFSKQAIWLICSVSLLFALGLLMVFNTTAAEIMDRNLPINTHAILLKQAAYGAVGIVLGLLVYWLGHQKLLSWSMPLGIFCTALLFLVFIPSIGQTINGSQRWIGFSGYTFQPSECAKIILPFCFIQWMVSGKEVVSWKGFIKIIGVLAIPMGLILMEPDTGATIILFLTFVLLFILCRIPWLYWTLPLLVLCGTAAIAVSQMPHVRNRINVYLNPELDLRGKGHQPYQAKIATGSGKLFGRGLGESLQKLNYLPEARSDYIAAIYAEESGFVGVCILIALYLSLFYSGISIAIHAEDRAAFLTAAMLSFLIATQAFVNLGVVCGLLPSKGMTLPFFSQGGSSLIMNFIAFFLLLDIARSNSLSKKISPRYTQNRATPNK